MERDTLASNKRMILALVAAMSAGMLLAACNTTEGVGDDIEALGDGISDTARDAKD